MRKTLVGIFFIFLSAVGLYAQGSIIEAGQTYIRPVQQRDSVLIADQLYYGFELKEVEQGTLLNVPIIEDTLMTGIKVVSPFELKQTAVKSRGEGYPDLIDFKGEILITSFDEGIYYLPPLTLQRVSSLGVVDTLVFSPQVLEVKTMPIDTATFKPHDIKGLIEYPVTFKEVAPWLFGGLGVAAVLALLIWVLMKKIKKKGPEHIVKDPAHIVALRELEKYRGTDMWVPEKQKEFYSGITDVLREYISDRYGFGAMEMTTSEIFREFKNAEVPDSLLEELKDLFERADFVKFAKYVASEQDNSKVLPVAVRFVTSTYQAELEGDTVESEIEIKEEE